MAVGGTAIFTCQLVQFLVVLGLLGISASTVLGRDSIYASLGLDIQITQCAFYVRTGTV